MTAHELARKLLELPDIDVLSAQWDGMAEVEEIALKDGPTWQHGQDKPPEKFIVLR